MEEQIASIELLDNAKTQWQKINLPHTWNQWDATDNNPGYRRDTSWYKKEIFVPDFKGDRVLRLLFEGVNISSEVFVNGEKVGAHIGGYVGFRMDITPFIKKGVTNEILVRADNSIDREIIPSQKSDFYIYGGITRDVWLEVLPQTHIDRIHVLTPSVDSLRAETEIEMSVVSPSSKKEIVVSIAIAAPDGQVVAEKTVTASIHRGKNLVRTKMPTINRPALWSPATPNLYTATVIVENSDRVSERFGCRWFEFNERGPFYLNGQRLLLRGTHRHEDYAGYANAMPDSLHRKDIAMIKEMGANFVRLAHYPQDPEVYRACDELGLIVWDELPWCRGGLGNKTWKENTRRLFREQIAQNFNHPSIIFWSVGNELYWLPDFPGGGNPDSLKAFVKELNDIAHELDPARLTTVRKFYDGADITDTFSPSIWAGWYSGIYKKYEKALISSREKYKRFLHAEYGGSSHVGRHTENPITGEGLVKEDEWAEKPNMIKVPNVAKAGDWSENYIVDVFDWHLMVSERLDWFSGNAQWAFKDFPTPLRPENPIPYMNQKGLVDRAGNPKDAYYVFKSYWTTEPSFCYIESHTWNDRTGRVGEAKQVRVFSNCDEVALYLDGKSLGKKKRNPDQFPACGLFWDVTFKKGRNRLQAVGFNAEQQVAFDTMFVIYEDSMFDAPAELKLASRLLSTGNILIQASIVDKYGRVCLDYNSRVYFDRSGSGELLAGRGTPTGSDVIEFANGRAAIEFKPGTGQAVIEARTQNFKGTYTVVGQKQVVGR